MPEPAITHLERRRIEAAVLIPMLRAFQRAIGEERANGIARDAVADLARQDGERWAERFGGDLAGMERLFEFFAAGGGLEIGRVARSPDELRFDVTRCAYAEFYRQSGAAEFGYLFSCARDLTMVEGFDPDMSLERTQTIMEGASCCDFRYRIQERE